MGTAVNFVLKENSVEMDELLRDMKKSCWVGHDQVKECKLEEVANPTSLRKMRIWERIHSKYKGHIMFNMALKDKLFHLYYECLSLGMDLVQKPFYLPHYSTSSFWIGWIQSVFLITRFNYTKFTFRINKIKISSSKFVLFTNKLTRTIELKIKY